MTDMYNYNMYDYCNAVPYDKWHSNKLKLLKYFEEKTYAAT